MALLPSLLQLRTHLLPPPPPGATDYSGCPATLPVSYAADSVKQIRRPYPRYAVRTLETKRADQVIELDRFWVLERELGVGSFGAVYRVRVRSTGHSYALKILRKNDFATIKSLSQLLREIGILGSVSHKNIVRLYELLETRDLFLVVMEDCRGGELLARMTALPTFPESFAKTILRALFSALVYLHDRHIVHRDLKLENILLADDPPEYEDWAEVRIADFGLANFMEDRGLRTRCGTFHYMPPEIIRGRPYGPPVDLWSAGVILYILLSGSYPFDAEDAATIMTNIKRGKWEFPEPEWVSKEALDLMNGLIVVDPEKRLTAQQALNHPWFRDTPATPGLSPAHQDHKKWLSNMRKNHVVRNYIRKIVTHEQTSPYPLPAPPPQQNILESGNLTWPAVGTTVPEAGNGAVGHGSGVVSGPRSVGSESSAGSDLPEIKEEGEGKSDEKVSQNGQQAEPANGSVPKDKLAGGVAPAFSVTPPTISLHKRRSSSMTGSHSHLPHSPPSITLPSATLTTHASGNISSPAETPTPHLDDKTWFHVGLPRLLNDMSAVFQAQLAGKEDHAGLQLLRSTRGRSTDDYFTGIGGVEVAPHPETPKELAERYAQESEDEKERRHRRNESLTGKLAMEPVAEEDETTPVLDEDIDRNPTPGELAIQEKMDSMGLREASLGAGSDITAVTERSEPYSS